MTLRPEICATSSQTKQRKENRDRDKSPGRTFASRQNRLSHKDSPGSHTPHYKTSALYNKSRIATAGLPVVGVRGATAPAILSSRPSATLEAITRSDSAACESAGRYTMRLVTSCITGRRPRTPCGSHFTESLQRSAC